jgi:peptide/nickel transport system ATP-binding protein
VGESGSGKSSLGKVLLGMEPVSSGEVLWKGKVIDFSDRSSLQNFRRSAQPVFQDPFSALNPRMKIGTTLAEAIMVRWGVDDIEIKVSDLLKEVGLDESDAEKYPGSFSGGQRQRIVLARALAIEPEFLVLDESVAALDLRIQAEILNLLSEIQKERDLAFLFISHDLTVIEAICDRVLIMKSGEIVEEAETQTLFSNPKNPYTKRLLKSRPGLQEIRN